MAKRKKKKSRRSMTAQGERKFSAFVGGLLKSMKSILEAVIAAILAELIAKLLGL